jgi:hypothetical protein
MTDRPTQAHVVNPAEERAAFLQVDDRAYVRDRLGTEPWVVVHGIERVPSDAGLAAVSTRTYFSTLVPGDLAPAELRDPSWEVRHDPDQLAGYVEVHRGDTVTRSYARYGDEKGREPLVVPRRFHLEPALDGVEINESFRLFFNLYFDRARDAYVRFDRDGNPQDIVRIHDGVVRVDGPALRQFLGARRMHLVLKFGFTRVARLGVEALDLDGAPEAAEEVASGPLFVYRWGYTPLSYANGRPTAELIGKRLVPGIDTIEDPSPFRRSGRRFESFVIDRDARGDDVTHSCDPTALANNFGANQGAPHYLTPVFFRREVLQKYYARPDRYQVEDGGVRCGGIWQLRLDNHHERYVVAFLGDLGRDLSEAEQRYWRSFNVPPDGGLSPVAHDRAILGAWREAERADFVFKQRLEKVNRAWAAATGWPLFLPLAPGDAHLLDGLRIPLADSDAEFDGQVLGLTKVLVDSLNEAEIARACPTLPADARGSITKLAAYLKHVGAADADVVVAVFRDLQDLRSASVAHRKGSRAESVRERLGLTGVDRITGYTRLLGRAIRALDALDAHARRTSEAAGGGASSIEAA